MNFKNQFNRVFTALYQKQKSPETNCAPRESPTPIPNPEIHFIK